MLVALVGCTNMSIPLDPYANVAADTSGSSGGCVQTLFYQDLDDDKFGNPNVSVSACTAPAGYVKDNTDCDDTKATTNPKADELCNKIDDNCDGIIDNTTTVLWWADKDKDGHGDPKFSPIQGTCKASSDWLASVGDDCDDNPDPHVVNGKTVLGIDIHPGATEKCNGVDDNCDGQTDEGVTSTFYVDADLDGYGSQTTTQACDPGNGVAISSNDCDDILAPHLVNGKTVLGADIHPGATEVCNGVDDNCNGQTDEGKLLTFHKDVDGDGYGDPNQPVEQCSALPGTVTDGTDCNDSDPKIHPGATEICNGVDDNCNGQTDEGAKLSFYRDVDGDGFGDVSQLMQACTQPLGFVKDSTDCDDTDKTIYPGAPEICDGKINGCTGTLNEPDSLCDDKNKFTKDTCGGASGCSHESQKVILSCFNPPDYTITDGYSCSVGYFFGDPSVAGQFEVTIGTNSVSLLMEDVCTKLKAGLTLRVNSAVFLDWDPMAAIWVGGQFAKLTDSFTNAVIAGLPGNVTVLGQGLDFNYLLAQFPECQ